MPQPAGVPLAAQNRAPAASGLAQARHVVAVWAAATASPGGADGDVPDWPHPAADVPLPAIWATGAAWAAASAAFTGLPQRGQATHDGSSIWAEQLGQRPGVNGSRVPQEGQATASRSMYAPQWGHGCLNVGIASCSLSRQGRRPLR